MKKIKTYKELEQIVDDIQKQGFGYINTYDLHNSKISNIKSNANILNVKFSDHDYNNDINTSTTGDDYDTIIKKSKKFFSKFKPDDKIFEIISKISIVPDKVVKTPYEQSKRKDVIEWIKFIKKYNIEDDEEKFGRDNRVNYYDLDKSMIKIHYYDNKSDEIKSLYKLIYGKEVEINEWKYPYGEWINLGEIEIKIFQNDRANIKGNISKLKEYYYKYLTKPATHRYAADIIKYNKKTTTLYEIR